MIIQKTPTKIDKIVSLQIGQHQENVATQIKMDVSDWITVHPTAGFHILFKRPGETQAQPVLSSLEEGILTWIVQTWETSLIGVGYAEIRAIEAESALVAKSRVIPCSVEESVIEDGEVPPHSGWVERVLSVADLADDLEQSITDGIEDIQSESAEQIAAVEAKGEETKASIPTDYTALTTEVSDLKSALNRKTYYSKLPVLRNGSIPNPGNENAVATETLLSTNGYDRFIIEYVGDTANVDDVYSFGVTAFGEGATDGMNTSAAYSNPNIRHVDVLSTPYKEKYLFIDASVINSVGDCFAVSVFRKTVGGDYNPIRIATDQKSVLFTCVYPDEHIIKLQTDVTELQENTDNIERALNRKTYYSRLPILRNGSVQNLGNANAVATENLLSVNGYDHITIEYVGDTANVDDVYSFGVVAFGEGATEGMNTSTAYSSASIAHRDVVVTGYQDKYLDVDCSVIKSIGECFAVTLFRKTKDGAYHPMRIVTDQQSILITCYYADKTQGIIADLQGSVADLQGSVDEIESEIANGEKYLGLENALAITKNYQGATYNGSSNMKTLPIFVHTTDIHGDSVRFNRAIKVMELIGADAMLATGDFIAYYPTDPVPFTAPVDALVFPAIGNHDASGMTLAQMQAKFITPLCTDAGFVFDNVPNPTYYYYDIADKKIRVISLNQFEGGSTQFRVGYSSAQLQFFANALKNTPQGYGVLVIYHKMEYIPPVDQNYSKFAQKLVGYQDISTMKPITEIVDAFISGTVLSKTYTNDDGTGTASVSVDFSTKASGVEFIAHVNGHEHYDRVGYYPTTNKQLVLNEVCTNAWTNRTRDGEEGTTYAGYNEVNDLARALDTVTQDAFNVYVIDRVHKTVRIARIGARLSAWLDRECDYMVIPYSD